VTRPAIYADGCPCCCTRDNEPRLATIRDHTLVAVYRCRACRHGWWTAWNLYAHGAAA
jgi:hypothetical protein